MKRQSRDNVEHGLLGPRVAETLPNRPKELPMRKIYGIMTATVLAVATTAGAFAATPAPTTTPAAATAPTSPAATPATAAQPANPRHAMLPKARVEAIQTALNGNGEKVAVDGKWGRQTSGAVKEFQQKHGLKPTGHVDHATLEQLKLPSKA
jgi:peptidoglycan hydrolase-like protein with peptidoglycan-binding domain